MAIADIKARQQGRVTKGPPCAVCDLLASVDETEAAALRALLADKSVRFSNLAAALRDDEDTKVDIPANTLGRHARGDCAARERLRG